VTTEQLEVERKFDVDPTFVLPDLAGVGGAAEVDDPVEHHLEAVYHDTPDLRLARARVTLRRRTGGSDAGWHLKLPAADGARRELHEPLGPATTLPPAAVALPVLGVLRGADAAPVATLQTRRLVTVLRDAGGRPLAEVADDTVTATVPAPGPAAAAEVLTWREVEVELDDGDEALLAAVEERLVAAGARPSPSASKLARALGDRLAAAADGWGAGPGTRQQRRLTAGEVVLAAVRAQVGALQDADVMVRTDQPDAVHKLRVACRRLRSIFAAYRHVLDRAVTEPLRTELRWLGAELSDARDDEVALVHLRKLVASEPPELVLGPVAARLQQTALGAAAAGHERALATLADPRYLRLLDALYALLDDPPLAGRAGHRARNELRRAVRRSVRRLRKRMRAARQATDGDRFRALHEVRKAAKRVRYAAEVAIGVEGRRAKDMVDTMEQVQDLLGEAQDTAVTREHCRRLGLAADGAGENAWTYGRLHALEQRRAELAEQEFWRGRRRLRRAVKAATS
jgi:CHAD domain-containing protein